MSETKPSIFGTAWAGWRDGLAAWRAMPFVALCAFVALLFTTVTTDVILIATTTKGYPWEWHYLGLPLAFVYSLLLAPAIIAVSRYVLLGEVARGYDLNLSRRLLLSVAYGTVLQLLLAFAVLGITAADPTSEAPTATEAIVILGSMVSFLLLLVFSVITWILFAAIAVDAPGAGFWKAARDTHFWRAFFIMAVALLPFVVALLPGIWFDTTTGFTMSWLLAVVIAAAAETLLVAALATIGARLYVAWGVRLREA